MYGKIQNYYIRNKQITIEKQPQAIICDYCGNNDYYYGNQRQVWQQAKDKGWLKYQGKHFDTLACLNSYKTKGSMSWTCNKEK